MMFKFISALSLAAMTAVFSIPALAQGGSDPIDGIDIIIRTNPNSKPIWPGNFGEKEIGLTYNSGTEKLEARMGELIDQTMKANGLEGNYRNCAARANRVKTGPAWHDLSKQIGEGNTGTSSFSCPSADGKSIMTVTVKIRGDEADKGRRELGKDGRPVSKYIGETEKNLEATPRRN